MKEVHSAHSISKKNKAHYSAAIVHKDIVYISGQLPIPHGALPPPPPGIEEQTKIALQNLEEVLKAAGSDKSKVLRTTIYLNNIEHWDIVNKLYAEFFGDHKPARTIIPTLPLHYKSLIELDAIAYIDS